MAPPGGKRMKGVQIYRPFIYGTTARPFNDTDNPKPPGVPADHTHSWQVFVKGIEDTDIFYWLRRVQFKLHESIPNHLRTLDADTIIREIDKSNNNNATTGNKKQQAAAAAAAAQNPNSNQNQNQQQQRAFVVNETGWGEFEITIKLYYDSRSGEKPQTLYHHLRLHPYGRTEDEKEAMRSGGEIVAWNYEEQLFNEPFEDFYHVLTTGAHDKGTKPPPLPASSGGGKGKGQGGGGKGGGNKAAQQQQQASSSSAAADGSGSGGGVGGDVKERSAMIPQSNKPGQPFSRDTEALEIKRLREAGEKVHQMVLEMNKSIKDKEAELTRLKAENAAPLPPAGAGAASSSSSATAATKKNATTTATTASGASTAAGTDNAATSSAAPASAAPASTTTTAAV
ncbi:NuA4 histone H4 acetyltransferase complex and the SWR1 complex subunit [Diatrype stigma]|uniref:Protein AF-9 homolog n=1 Tax=Diatrype stigma TaxID=117547 RepID=A0AAN9UVN9_9PEZI